VFIGEIRNELEQALQTFNRELPVNKHVRLLNKRGRSISLSPLEAQESRVNY
jgi:hypothetical protein